MTATHQEATTPLPQHRKAAAMTSADLIDRPSPPAPFWRAVAHRAVTGRPWPADATAEQSAAFDRWLLATTGPAGAVAVVIATIATLTAVL